MSAEEVTSQAHWFLSFPWPAGARLRGPRSPLNVKISAKIPLQDFLVSANIPSGLGCGGLCCGGSLALMGIMCSGLRVEATLLTKSNGSEVGVLSGIRRLWLLCILMRTVPVELRDAHRTPSLNFFRSQMWWNPYGSTLWGLLVIYEGP
jgi:hypothetical protein